MFWSSKPSRFKAFGLSLTLWLVCSFIASTLESDPVESENDILFRTDKDRIAESMILIDREEYTEAFDILSNVDSVNEEVERMMLYLDSLLTQANAADQLALEALEKQHLQKQFEIQINKLQKEVSSINEGIDFSVYRGSLEALQLEISLFAAGASLIRESENSPNPKARQVSDMLRTKVGRIQSEEFPEIRKEYGILTSKKLWENDIEVYTSGIGQRYINITGGAFAANRNKQSFQEEASQVFRMYRFTQARYRWYKSQSEYTYYEMKVLGDEELFYN